MAEATENDLDPGMEHRALRVMLRGLDQKDDPVKLLEDTARFLRDNAQAIEGRDRDEDIELMFKRVELGDFVIFSIKR